MIHDPELLDALSHLTITEFDGRVFRITSVLADATAMSQSGGRWAMDTGKEGGCPILYTSTTKEGAIAEVASYLGLLSPIPQKPLKLSVIEVSLEKTLKLGVADFGSVGIDASIFGERNYLQTQRVGAAINFLELDGLIAPSARWECDNLMIYGENHSLDKKLDIVEDTQIPFSEWKHYCETGDVH